MLYFEALVNTDNLLVSQRILSQMRNLIWILYLHFLDFVLPKFTNLNLMFQSSLSVLRIEYCTSTCYMIESSWKHKKLTEIDPQLEVSFLPLTNMYMGAKISLLLTTSE